MNAPRPWLGISSADDRIKSDTPQVRTRTGSQMTRWLPAGISRGSSVRSVPWTRTGISDSIPSTGVPSAIRSSISASSGCCSESSAARARTRGINSSSRQGGAHRPASAISSERWSATLNQRTSSTVPPELDPDGVLLGRREDVHDAAPDREVTAHFHQVGPRVADHHEALDEVVQHHLVARSQRDGFEVPQAGQLRLEQAADGGDHDLQRAGRRVVGSRVCEPTTHGESASDGVGAGGQPLVRQRLPARVERDRRRRQQAAQRADQVLGLATGRGDGQHRPAGASPARHLPRARRRRTGAARPAPPGPGPRRRRSRPRHERRGRPRRRQAGRSGSCDPMNSVAGSTAAPDRGGEPGRAPSLRPGQPYPSDETDRRRIRCRGRSVKGSPT